MCVAGVSCFCCRVVLVLLGLFCFVVGILFCCRDILVVLLSLIVMQSYNFFLNYLLRFPTARDFMFYVKLISIDFCVFFAKYKNVEQSKTPYLKLHIYAIFGSFLEPF